MSRRLTDILKWTTYWRLTSSRQSPPIRVPFPTSHNDDPQPDHRASSDRETTWPAPTHSILWTTRRFKPTRWYQLRKNSYTDWAPTGTNHSQQRFRIMGSESSCVQIFTKFLIMSDICTVLKREHFGKKNRNTLKATKCGAGEDYLDRSCEKVLRKVKEERNTILQRAASVDTCKRNLGQCSMWGTNSSPSHVCLAQQ